MWVQPNLDTEKGKRFLVFHNGKIVDNERWKKLLFCSISHCVGWEFPLCVSLRLGDVAWMGSQHLGFKRKQQPELLSVWKPRLRCSVSSAIVLVIVNLGHLPGGISHSSNKFHKTNHKVPRCSLPLIEFWAHKHISKCLTAWYGLSDDLLLEVWLPCLFICVFFWQEASSFGSTKGFFFFLWGREWRERRREVAGERRIGGD